jgi:flagella basal body P-ring formation protein FlgA
MINQIRPIHASVILALAFILHPSSFLLSGEIHLRSECDCSTGLVRLADVAEIHASDPAEAKSLGEIELFPVPAAGSKAFVRAREIQDLLALRGINLSRHRLSGASQIEVRRGGGKETAVRLTASVARRATDRVSEAIVSHLRRQSPDGEGWQVELNLTDEQLRYVAASRDELTAEGGEAPWTGRQKYVVIVPSAGGERSFTVEAKVIAAPLVVVATRGMQPGEIVQETDVKLAMVKPGVVDTPFYRLDEVIGQETKRALVLDQAIEHEQIRSPLLVKRGEAVAVYARAAGIQVRTTGRVNQDGGRGDLIVVESLDTRERFFARVTGIHEVEVYAEPSEAAGVADTAGRSEEAMLNVAALRDARDRGARQTGLARAPAAPGRGPIARRAAAENAREIDAAQQRAFREVERLKRTSSMGGNQ